MRKSGKAMLGIAMVFVFAGTIGCRKGGKLAQVRYIEQFPDNYDGKRVTVMGCVYHDIPDGPESEADRREMEEFLRHDALPPTEIAYERMGILSMISGIHGGSIMVEYQASAPQRERMVRLTGVVRLKKPRWGDRVPVLMADSWRYLTEEEVRRIDEMWEEHTRRTLQEYLTE